MTTGAGSPTASIAAPNAFGGGGTIIFANGSAVSGWPTSKNWDGFGSAGFSVGDPYKIVAALVSVNIADMGFNNSSFGANSGVGLRLNHYFTPTTAVALGAGNLVGWGDASTLAKNFYGSVTQAFYLGIPMSFNIGLGTGAFTNTLVPMTSDGSVYPFASMAFSVYRNVSLIADWSSHQVNLGGTYILTCIPKVPVFIGAYAMNVGEYQGTQAFFQGTIGLSYRF